MVCKRQFARGRSFPTGVPTLPVAGANRADDLQDFTGVGTTGGDVVENAQGLEVTGLAAKKALRPGIPTSTPTQQTPRQHNPSYGYSQPCTHTRAGEARHGVPAAACSSGLGRSLKKSTLLRHSDRDWIIVRPCQLTNAEATGKYRVLLDLTGVTVRKVARGDVAEFVLLQLSSDDVLHKTPLLTD